MIPLLILACYLARHILSQISKKLRRQQVAVAGARARLSPGIYSVRNLFIFDEKACSGHPARVTNDTIE
jgi:hypothetical protein